MSWTSPKTWTAAVLTSVDMNAHVRDNLNFLKTNIALEAAVELTISSGAVTKTYSHHTIDTESDAASDNLDTISGGAEGEVILIRPANGARTVVLKHNTGNIWNPSAEDVTLDDADDYAVLIFDGSKWCVVGGGAASDLAAHVADDNPHPVTVSTKTGTYTILASDDLLICNSASAFTVTLPAASGGGKLFYIKNINTGAVTIEGDSSDTIDGDANIVILQWESVTLIDYAANKWVIV